MSFLIKDLRRIKIANRPSTLKGIQVDETWYFGTPESIFWAGWFFGYTTDGSGDDYVYVLHRPVLYESTEHIEFLFGEVIDDVDYPGGFGYIPRLTSQIAPLRIKAGGNGIEVTYNGETVGDSFTNTLDATTKDCGWLTSDTTSGSYSTAYTCHSSLWKDYDSTIKNSGAALVGEASIPYARPFGIRHQGVVSLNGVASKSFTGNLKVYYLTVKNYRWYHDNGEVGVERTPAAAINTPIRAELGQKYVLRLHLKNEMGEAYPNRVTLPYLWKYEDNSGSVSILGRWDKDYIKRGSRYGSGGNMNTSRHINTILLDQSTPWQSTQTQLVITSNTFGFYIWRSNSGYDSANLAGTAVLSDTTGSWADIIAYKGGGCVVFHDNTTGARRLRYKESTDGATWDASWTDVYSSGHAFYVEVLSIRCCRTANDRIYVFWTAATGTRNRIYYTYSDDEGATWDTTNTNYSPSTTNTVLYVDEVTACHTGGAVVVRYLDAATVRRRMFMTFDGTTWSSEIPITDPTTLWGDSSQNSAHYRFVTTIDSNGDVNLFRVKMAISTDGDEEGDDDDLVIRRYSWSSPASTMTYEGGATLFTGFRQHDTDDTFNIDIHNPSCALFAHSDAYVVLVVPWYNNMSYDATSGVQKIAYKLADDTVKFMAFYHDGNDANLSSRWVSEPVVARCPSHNQNYFAFAGKQTYNTGNWRTALYLDGDDAWDTEDSDNLVLLGTDSANYRKDYWHRFMVNAFQLWPDVSQHKRASYSEVLDATVLANNAELEIEGYGFVASTDSWSSFRRRQYIGMQAYEGYSTNGYSYFRQPLLEIEKTDDDYIDANGAFPTHWNGNPTGTFNAWTVVTGAISAYRLRTTLGNDPNYCAFSFNWQGAATSQATISCLANSSSGSTTLFCQLWNITTSTQLDSFSSVTATTYPGRPVVFEASSNSKIISNGDEIQLRFRVGTGGFFLYVDRLHVTPHRYFSVGYVDPDYDIITWKQTHFKFDHVPKYYYYSPTILISGTATVTAAATLGTTTIEGAAFITGNAFVTAVGDYAGGTVTGLASYTGVATITPVATKGITDTLAVALSGVATAAAVGFVYRTQQVAYRWRNDDGTETSATWTAATNATISPQYNQIYRLRLGIYAVTATQIPPSHLEYRVNGTGDWKPVGGYQTAMQVPQERWIEEATYDVDLADYATDGLDYAGYNGTRFFVSGNGRWHIFYHAIPAGETYVLMHHVYSDNDGTSWTGPTSVPVPQWLDTGSTFGDGIVKSRRWGEIEVVQQPDGDLILFSTANGSEFVPNIGTYLYRHTHWTKSVNNGGSWADAQVINGLNGGNYGSANLKCHVIGNDEWVLTGVGGATDEYQRYPSAVYYDSGDADWWLSGAFQAQPSGYDEMQYVCGEAYIDGSGDLQVLSVSHDNPNSGEFADNDGIYPLAVVTQEWPAVDWDDPTTPAGQSIETAVLQEELFSQTSPLGSDNGYCAGYLIRNSTCTEEPAACSWFTPMQEDYSTAPNDADWVYGFYGKNGWETSDWLETGFVWVDEVAHSNAWFFDNQFTAMRITRGEDEHAIVKTNMSWYETFTPAVDLEDRVQFGLVKGVYPPTEVHTFPAASINQTIAGLSYTPGNKWMDFTPTIHWEQDDSKFYRVVYDNTASAEALVLQSLDTASGCYLRGTNNFDATTQQITSGTYQSSNKGMAMWGVAECRWHTIPANTYVEYEYYVKTAADGFGASDGDYVELRVYGIDEYLQLPTITYVREKAALTGVATVVANGDTDGPKSAVSAAATLSAVAEVVIPGAVALQGAATLAPLSKMDRFAACVAAGEAILAPAGYVLREAQISLSAAATLESDALSVVKGAWAVSAAASVSGIPTTEVACRASLSGVASASGNASADRPASAHLRGYALLGLRSDLCLLPGHRMVFRPSNEIIHWEYSGLETAYHPSEGQGHGGHPGQGEEHHTGGDPSDWGRVVPHETPNAIIEKAGVPEVVVYKQPTAEVTV